MVADSPLLMLASRLRSLLADDIDGLDIADVLIGTPKQAGELTAGGGRSQSHALNLFFYRFEPGSYPAAAVPEEPLYLRIFCLITAFASGGQGQNQTGAGQNDLRLLGEAMRALHQHPLLQLSVDDQVQASVQIIPTSMPTQELNQVWSMLGSETSYRPSVAYEFALVPIPLGRPVDPRPRVISVASSAVTSDDPGAWTRRPTLALITADGPAYGLMLPVNQRPASLRLQIEGRPEAALQLRWRLLQSKVRGWFDGPSEALLLGPAGSEAREVALPLDGVGQALVTVEPQGDPAGASDPVLVVLHDNDGGGG